MQSPIGVQQAPVAGGSAQSTAPQASPKTSVPALALQSAGDKVWQVLATQQAQVSS